MTKRTHRRLSAMAATFCTASLLALSSTAYAEMVEPGLWEVVSTIKNPEIERQLAAAQAQLNSLPPEMRKMMEQSMGVQFMSNVNTVRVCISPEEAQDPTEYVSGEGCNYRQTARTTNSISGHVDCQSIGGEGEFTTTIHNKKHYSTVAKFNSELGAIDMTSEARHIGADCSSLN